MVSINKNHSARQTFLPPIDEFAGHMPSTVINRALLGSRAPEWIDLDEFIKKLLKTARPICDQIESLERNLTEIRVRQSTDFECIRDIEEAYSMLRAVGIHSRHPVIRSKTNKEIPGVKSIHSSPSNREIRFDMSSKYLDTLGNYYDCDEFFTLFPASLLSLFLVSIPAKIGAYAGYESFAFVNNLLNYGQAFSLALNAAFALWVYYDHKKADLVKISGDLQEYGNVTRAFRDFRREFGVNDNSHQGDNPYPEDYKDRFSFISKALGVFNYHRSQGVDVEGVIEKFEEKILGPHRKLASLGQMEPLSEDQVREIFHDQFTAIRESREKAGYSDDITRQIDEIEERINSLRIKLERIRKYTLNDEVEKTLLPKFIGSLQRVINSVDIQKAQSASGLLRAEEDQALKELEARPLSMIRVSNPVDFFGQIDHPYRLFEGLGYCRDSLNAEDESSLLTALNVGSFPEEEQLFFQQVISSYFGSINEMDRGSIT